MKTKKKLKRSLLKLALELPTFAYLGLNLFKLIKYESVLAKKSVFHIIILVHVLSAFIVTACGLLLTILFMALMYLHVNIFLSLFIIFILNLILIWIVARLLRKNKRNISFPLTRLTLNQLQKEI